jgi:hypothetical protein
LLGTRLLLKVLTYGRKKFYNIGRRCAVGKNSIAEMKQKMAELKKKTKGTPVDEDNDRNLSYETFRSEMLSSGRSKLVLLSGMKID